MKILFTRSTTFRGRVRGRGRDYCMLTQRMEREPCVEVCRAIAAPLYVAV